MNNPIIRLTNANAEKFDDEEIENTSGFVNDLIEKYFGGKLVELDDENKKMVDRLSFESGKTNIQVVNRCLSSATFVITKEEKPVIEINKNPVAVKRKRQPGSNPAIY